MGIRNLNKFLLKHCNNSSIFDIHLSELYGKKIAIDISIFLYKFERNNKLLQNIYNMISIFKYYNIIPVFIFDGKPPKEKKYILQQRKEEKNANKIKIQELEKILNENINLVDDEKYIILNKINKIKSQTIFITNEKIQQVKNIIRMEGMTYFDAPQEADELCAMLTIREQVWACMSDDMDLFAYGCPRVLRYFNIYSHTTKIYFMDDILYNLTIELKLPFIITLNDFKQICILLGTDYNSHHSNVLQNNLIELFKIYKNSKLNFNYSFLYWIIEQFGEILDLDYELLAKINNMFDLYDFTKLRQFNDILILNFV